MMEEKKDYIAEILEKIDDEYIAEAAKVSTGNGRFRWRRWMTVAAACVCLLAGAAIVWELFYSPAGKGESTFSEKGVTIPKEEVSLNKQEGWYSGSDFVIYDGNVYQAAKDEVYDNLQVEDYLGEATGLIDGWTEQDGYPDFAGTYKGKLYEVKGIEPSFAIALEWEKGGSILLIRDNNITLEKGSDLYEKRLHLAENYETVTYCKAFEWISEDEWPGQQLDLTNDKYREAMTGLLDALNEGEICDSMEIDEDLTSMRAMNFMLEIRMKNNMKLSLIVMDSGYVAYAGMPGVCVKIPKEVINAFSEIEMEGTTDDGTAMPDTGDVISEGGKGSEGVDEGDVMYKEQSVLWEDETESRVGLYKSRKDSRPYIWIDGEKLYPKRFSDAWASSNMAHSEIQFHHDIDEDGKNEITIFLCNGAVQTLTDFWMLRQKKDGKWEIIDLPEQMTLEHSYVNLEVKNDCKLGIRVPATGYQKTVDVSKRAYFSDYFKKEGKKAIVGIDRVKSEWWKERHLRIYYYIYANNAGDEMGVLCQQIDWNGEKNCLELGKTWYEHRIWE